MVRVPGSLVDAGFHRESQEDEDVQVKIELKTEESLEDRSPVTKENKNKGSKDRPDLGRAPVNMVKVELIGEKPKYPPYVLVEDTLGHDTYHAPEDQQPTVKTERLRSPKQQKTEVTQSKSRKFKMKAPGDTKSVDPKSSGPSTWSDADVAMAYHRCKLDVFLKSDRVTKTLEIRLLGQLDGSVSTLPQLRTITDAITALVTLLREAGMVAGRFEPDDLFALGFDNIKTTLAKLHKRLKIVVGTTPAKCDLPAASVKGPSRDSHMTLQDIEVHPQTQEATWDPRSMQGLPRDTLLPCAQAAAGRSSKGSSASSPVRRMPLGPTGAVLLQARARDAEWEQRALETVTRGQPMKSPAPDRLNFQPIENQQGRAWKFTSPRGEDAGEEASTNRVDNLQIYFDAAMARFLQEHQVPQTHPNWGVARGRQGAQMTAA